MFVARTRVVTRHQQARSFALRCLSPEDIEPLYALVVFSGPLALERPQMGMCYDPQCRNGSTYSRSLNLRATSVTPPPRFSLQVRIFVSIVMDVADTAKTVTSLNVCII